MTRDELIQIGASEVRRNETLMKEYLEEFENMFGRQPQCAGCTFKSDWKNFIKGNGTQARKTQTKMSKQEEKSFVLKRQWLNKIFRIVKEDGKISRVYGSRMTEAFAVELLKDDRYKTYFEKLPTTEEEQEETDTDIRKLKVDSLRALAATMGIETEGLLKKDLIDAIEEAREG